VLQGLFPCSPLRDSCNDTQRLDFHLKRRRPVECFLCLVQSTLTKDADRPGERPMPVVDEGSCRLSRLRRVHRCRYIKFQKLKSQRDRKWAGIGSKSMIPRDACGELKGPDRSTLRGLRAKQSEICIGRRMKAAHDRWNNPPFHALSVSVQYRQLQLGRVGAKTGVFCPRRANLRRISRQTREAHPCLAFRRALARSSCVRQPGRELCDVMWRVTASPEWPATHATGRRQKKAGERPAVHSVQPTHPYMRKSLLEAYVARAEGGAEVPFIHRDVFLGSGCAAARHARRTHIQRLPTTTRRTLAPNSTHSRPPQKQSNERPAS